MNGEFLQSKVKIISPAGFHMRPLTAFAELAGKYQSTVTVYKDDQDSGKNGKSPWDLLGLVAEQGSELTLKVSGPDQQAALDALVELLVGLSVAEATDGPAVPPNV